MEIVYLTPDQVPPVIRRACSGYSGRKFQASIHASVTLSNGYWDGGSRSTYVAVNLETGETSGADPAIKNPFRCPQSPTVELQPGLAIVEHSIFCGKDSGITIHLHPSNVVQFLPAPEELSRTEKIVLTATRSFKSNYAGISNYRFHEARSITGITLEEWESAKASLIARKLLNKAGAVTTAGKNAGRFDLRALRPATSLEAV